MARNTNDMPRKKRKVRIANKKAEARKLQERRDVMESAIPAGTLRVYNVRDLDRHSRLRASRRLRLDLKEMQ